MHTRRVELSAAIAVSIWMTACAHVMNVYRRPSGAMADPRYVTFFVLQGHSSGNPAVDRQLEADITTELTNRGFAEAPRDEADAVVVVHVATPASQSRAGLYKGWGGWSWRIAGAQAPDGTEDYEVGALVVDVFDAWTKRLVWHGAVAGGVSGRSGNTTRVTRHAAARVLRDFPFAESQAGTPSRDAQSMTATTERMRIIFSQAPAVLVRIDGEPRFEHVPGTELHRVINTRTVILRDAAGMHYLRLADGWMEAPDLTDSWYTAGAVPEGADVALARALADARADLFSSARSDGSVPVVCVATTPAALVVTEGEPRYVPFNGTPLRYVSNTTGTVFREPTDQELYVRIPAGWFRAWTTNGPWEQVPDDRLPADLPRIGSARF